MLYHAISKTCHHIMNAMLHHQEVERLCHHLGLKTMQTYLKNKQKKFLEMDKLQNFDDLLNGLKKNNFLKDLFHTIRILKGIWFVYRKSTHYLFLEHYALTNNWNFVFILNSNFFLLPLTSIFLLMMLCLFYLKW